MHQSYAFLRLSTLGAVSRCYHPDVGRRRFLALAYAIDLADTAIKGEAYLSANGVSYSKPESFCALGKKEIARSSAIGIYLKAK